jgi:hypothetical protein
MDYDGTKNIIVMVGPLIGFLRIGYLDSMQSFVELFSDAESSKKFILLQKVSTYRIEVEARRVDDYKFAPYEMVIDMDEGHFFLVRFNFEKTYDTFLKKPSLSITNLSYQKYIKPSSYTSQQYVITKNYIAVVANSEVIPEFQSTTLFQDFRRRSFFLMVWQKAPFAEDTGKNLDALQKGGQEKYEIYKELIDKPAKRGSGYTYRIE